MRLSEIISNISDHTPKIGKKTKRDRLFWDSIMFLVTGDWEKCEEPADKTAIRQNLRFGNRWFSVYQSDGDIYLKVTEALKIHWCKVQAE